MIKAILLAAFVPFLTQHRNITPSNEVSTCFYGSVTGIVDNAYIAAHGGGGSGGTITNAVNYLIREYDTTNLTARIASKRDITNRVWSAAGYTPWTCTSTDSTLNAILNDRTTYPNGAFVWDEGGWWTPPTVSGYQFGTYEQPGGRDSLILRGFFTRITDSAIINFTATRTKIPEVNLALTSELASATNATLVAANQYTDQHVGGITTNDVNAIIASSNLCTVSAAQAMTNGLLKASAADALYVKTKPDPAVLNDPIGFDESGKFEIPYSTTVQDFISEADISCYGKVSPMLGLSVGSWGDIYTSSDQTLPQYLASLEWHPSNATLSGYGITDAYTKSQIDGNAVTNGGAVSEAKAYADANFLKGTKEGFYTTNFTTREIPIFINGISFNSQMKIYKKDDTYEPYFIDDIFVFEGSDTGQGTKQSELKVDGSDIITQDKGDNRYLRSYTETDPTATAKAQAAIASTLTGRTYDFANGVNFTKTLYTALTNVIQTLGGTVANPPAFN